MKIGVLALQGGFAAHAQMLKQLGHQTTLVKRPRDFPELAALILPGGESSTQLHLLQLYELIPCLEKMVHQGKPLWGTCAGLILLAEQIEIIPQFSLGFLRLSVQRNAYGAQKDSFAANLAIPAIGASMYPGIFIRAPKISKIGKGVEILASHGEEAVLVREGRIWGSTFHPELTQDSRLHQLFLQSCF